VPMMRLFMNSEVRIKAVFSMHVACMCMESAVMWQCSRTVASVCSDRCFIL
jgi:hypothetical protein